jgi:hemoglobin
MEVIPTIPGRPCFNAQGSLLFKKRRKMRKLRGVMIALCLLAALFGDAMAQEKSLYERLGGKDAIKAVVDELVIIVAADPRINKKFAKSNVDRLKFMLVEQICAVTGGPCKYKGRDMKTAHKNMAVTEGEFNALVDNLVAALNKFKVPEKEQKELLGILAPMKPQIVEVNSQETGTPLPANFKPAPPLKGKAVAKAGKDGKKK